MTAQSLLDDLTSRSVVLTVNGDQLDIDAPDDVLTDELLTTLRENKAELLDLLRPPADSDCPISIGIGGASPPAPEGSTPVTTTRCYEVERILEDVARRLSASIKNSAPTEQTNQAAEVGWGLDVCIRHAGNDEISISLRGGCELGELPTDVESRMSAWERQSPNVTLSNPFWEWSLRASHKEQ